MLFWVRFSVVCESLRQTLVLVLRVTVLSSPSIMPRWLMNCLMSICRTFFPLQRRLQLQRVQLSTTSCRTTAAWRTRLLTMCTVRILAAIWADADHVIPKPSQEQGLIVGWPSTKPSKEQLTKVRMWLYKLTIGIWVFDGKDAQVNDGYFCLAIVHSRCYLFNMSTFFLFLWTTSETWEVLTVGASKMRLVVVMRHTFPHYMLKIDAWILKWMLFYPILSIHWI